MNLDNLNYIDMRNHHQDFEVRNIIDDLGGVTAVATLCQLTPGAVSQWEDSIPKKHFKAIITEAKKLDLEVTLEHLLGMNKYKPRKKKRK